MAERVKIVRSAAPELIKELEALAKPLLAAIAIARRLPAIELPTDDDGRIGAGIYKMANEVHKGFRIPVVATEQFLRALGTLEEAMQRTADRVPWHQRGLDG
jgi:hypothetical protein